MCFAPGQGREQGEELWEQSTTRGRIETVETARGAPTIVLDADRDTVSLCMPQPHRAAVSVNTGT